MEILLDISALDVMFVANYGKDKSFISFTNPDGSCKESDCCLPKMVAANKMERGAA